MNKTQINRHFFIAFLIGLSVILHAIIPHDHHYINNSEKDKQTENKTQSQENHFLHCFAFNNLIVEKSNTFFNQILKKFQNTGTFKIIDSYFLNRQNLKAKKPLFKTHFRLTEYIFSKIEPVRGSPSFV